MCRTVTRSAYWKKKHEDPLAAKQKWYCPHCEAGYNTKFGVIVQIIVKRAAFGMPEATEEDDNFEIQAGIWSREWIGLYCKADLPPQHFQGLTCMVIEKSNHGVQTQAI